MDNGIVILISALASLIGALGGGGVMYYRQTKQLKEAEVEAKQSDEWRKLFEQTDADSREKDKKIDGLYEQRQELYNTLLEKDRLIASKDIEIQRLNFSRCYVNGCRRRQPPRDYEQDTYKNEAAAADNSN